MEDKKQPGSPPQPTPPPSSLVADLFGAQSPPDPSPSLFHSMFPPASAVMGKNSSRSDIFDPKGKHEAKGKAAQNVAADASTSLVMHLDGMSEGNAHRDENPAYQHEKMEPCSFSSSLYYGGRDIYISSSTPHNFDGDYKTGGEDESNNAHVACRGNWWQGSLYY